MGILVFDFGGTSVKYGIWSQDEVKEKGSFWTPKIWDELVGSILRVKQQFEKTYALKGAAFSFPGAVDGQAGIIHQISAIKYLEKIPLAKRLEEILSLPVAIENDANCAALAELWMGAAQDVKNALFVVFGTGVGGVVVINGEIHRGKHFFGGEFGVLEFERGKTFSSMATAVSMAKRYCERAGVAAGTFDGKAVFEKALAGDLIAQDEVDSFYHYAALGIYNLQACFDPQRIIIGGGLSASDAIIQKIAEKVACFFTESNYPYIQADIQPCWFKNDANLIGAVNNFHKLHPEMAS